MPGTRTNRYALFLYFLLSFLVLHTHNGVKTMMERMLRVKAGAPLSRLPDCLAPRRYLLLLVNHYFPAIVLVVSSRGADSHQHIHRQAIAHW